MQTCTRVSNLPTPSAVGAGVRVSVSPSTTSVERQTPFKERFRRKGAAEETEPGRIWSGSGAGERVFQPEPLCFPSLVPVGVAHTRPPTHTLRITRTMLGEAETRVPTHQRGCMWR